MCIGDVVGTRVENILYFFESKDCWEAWEEGHWGMLERFPKKKSFEAIGAKKDIINMVSILLKYGNFPIWPIFKT
jgi:hypothetical protein